MAQRKKPTKTYCTSKPPTDAVYAVTPAAASKPWRKGSSNSSKSVDEEEEDEKWIALSDHNEAIAGLTAHLHHDRKLHTATQEKLMHREAENSKLEKGNRVLQRALADYEAKNSTLEKGNGALQRALADRDVARNETSTLQRRVSELRAKLSSTWCDEAAAAPETKTVPLSKYEALVEKSVERAMAHAQEMTARKRDRNIAIRERGACEKANGALRDALAALQAKYDKGFADAVAVAGKRAQSLAAGAKIAALQEALGNARIMATAPDRETLMTAIRDLRAQQVEAATLRFELEEAQSTETDLVKRNNHLVHCLTVLEKPHRSRLKAACGENPAVLERMLALLADKCHLINRIRPLPLLVDDPVATLQEARRQMAIMLAGFAWHEDLLTQIQDVKDDPVKLADLIVGFVYHMIILPYRIGTGLDGKGAQAKVNAAVLTLQRSECERTQQMAQLMERPWRTDELGHRVVRAWRTNARNARRCVVKVTLNVVKVTLNVDTGPISIQVACKLHTILNPV